MNAAGQVEWLSSSFVWALIGCTSAVIAGWVVSEWIRINAKWERDLPRLLDHNDDDGER